jgi:hypothetical protein
MHRFPALVPGQVDVRQTLEDTVQATVDFVPRLLLFIVILVVGWIIAKILRTVLTKILERIRFDQLVQRSGIGETLANTKYDAIGLLTAVLYYAVLLIALQLAFAAFGPNPISDLLASVVAWLPHLFIAIIIIVIVAAIARVVRDLLSSVLGGLSYGDLVARIASYFIIALGVIAALNQVGVATTVTTPVLIAVLATVGGVIVVGAGGGLVRPMQERWEGWLDRASSETPTGQAQAGSPQSADTAYAGSTAESRSDQPYPPESPTQ